MQTIMPYRPRRRHASLGFPMERMMAREMRRFDMAAVMKTDISQTEGEYRFSMELPGFSKDDVQLEVKDGYLIVSAEMSSQSEEAPQASAEEGAASQEQPEAADKKEEAPEAAETWVRRERFFGSCRRSFYLGEDIDEENISAKFENGLLSISVPKAVEEPQPEERKLIEIQG